MATYNEIKTAIEYAWEAFSESLERELGDDYSDVTFYNLADSVIVKIDDYVMQATDFGVNCPSCNERLDNEDEINEDDTCWSCEEGK